MNEAEQKEYDALYQAEMDKLNAAAQGEPETTDAADDKQAPAQAEADPVVETEAEPAPEEDPLKKLEARLASTEKALNDTKSWASKNAAEVKRLRKEQEERDRRANRPELLDDNPGLEEAIRHVARVPNQQPAEDATETWADTVGTALPDIDALLENDDFKAKATAKARELGDSWTNPIIAIRELGLLQREHERAATGAAAQEAARRDFQQKTVKKAAMQMPSGSAPARQAIKADPVKEIEEMSDADFKKMRAKTLGYGG